ncbi:ATPeF0F [Mytilus coruscus]|uniref:ATPeF0F n=1 Tax=Mytilus coruscus TaxID=42192 RepID=A0A6J8C7Z5_MYTCO|nr:ATPeF0F [Mytilus coruscus]
MGIKQEIEELPKKLVEVTSKRERQVPGETSWENIQKKFGKGTGFTQALPKLFQYFGAGTYPKEFNPRVHGPYYPSRYYGKADVSFWDCKLGELPKWFGRRQLGIRPFSMVLSRRMWTVMQKYKTSAASMYFIWLYGAVGMTYFYIMQYPKYSNERHSKYH